MKFSEFNKSSESEGPTPTMVIDGSFSCQTCNECVDEAEYFQAQKILRWKCAEGHISFIEDWSI